MSGTFDFGHTSKRKSRPIRQSSGGTDKLRTAPPTSFSTDQAADLFDNRPDKDWLNPIAMSVLQRAVRAKRDVVQFPNGHEFSIEYDFVFHLRGSNINVECVRLKRTDGFLAPFGYISMRRILDFEFEKE